MITRVWTTLLLLASLAATAAAQTPQPADPPPGTQQQPPPPPPPQFPQVKMGMTSFLQYNAELKNRDGFNAFDITRGYININAALSPRVRFRFTPDVRRITDGSLAGSLTLRVKYGFAQFDDVLGAKS